MTELGHSSHLRELETIATYTSGSDYIVINSPTLLATKWWIGNAGKVSL
jgi:acyl-CoA oxidase